MDDYDKRNMSFVFCDTDTPQRLSKSWWRPYNFRSDELGDNCIVFENFTASIGDLMVAN